MRRIFIGSSTEALGQVSRVSGILHNAFGTDVQIIEWSQAFEPGVFTLEAIEHLAKNVSGAILLATPDDASVIRDQNVMVPRANVMFELGYFAAVLGRKRTALCKYQDVTLPTDLNGVTYINMGRFSNDNPNFDISNQALDKILSWARALNYVTEGLSGVQIFHGYSGRWQWNSFFERWCGIEIQQPDFVLSRGIWDLFIPIEGGFGFGSSQANVFVNIKGCYSEFRNQERISNIQVQKDGTLQFELEVFDRHLVKKDGVPPQKRGFKEIIQGPPIQLWKFKPEKGSIPLLVGLRHDKIQDVRQKVTAIKYF
jgi:hypothetical protein